MGGDPRPRSAATALEFAQTARRLGAAARAEGLTVPAFRSPPRLRGAVRTVRHYPGGALISVVRRDRSLMDVTADMVEGVVRANRLDGDAAGRARAALLAAAREAPPEDRLPSNGARMAERQTQAA
jgi:hypothetical protein